MPRRAKLDLVGIYEIGEQFSLTKQRTFTYTKMKDFPLPALHLAQGRIWYRSQVETFFRNRGRTW
jgi:hypothetical protein